MQSHCELKNTIQCIKWYYSGKTVQEILKLHEKNFPNYVAPTERKIKWWILLFETNGCINPMHYSTNIKNSDIDKVPDAIDISHNLDVMKCEVDTSTDLVENLEFSEHNWEKNDNFNANNDTKVIEIPEYEAVNYSNNMNNLNIVVHAEKSSKAKPNQINKNNLPKTSGISALTSLSDKKIKIQSSFPIDSNNLLEISTNRHLLRPRFIREPWTQEQKNLVCKFFKMHILKKKSPKVKECQLLKEQYPKLLENKNYHDIKSFIQHKYSHVSKNNVIKID